MNCAITNMPIDSIKAQSDRWLHLGDFFRKREGED